MDTRTALLSAPIKRGETTINRVTLRKPDTGSLRGLALVDVLRMEMKAIGTLALRISDLSASEFEALDPRDILTVSAEIVSFFAQPEEVSAPSPKAH
jgi:hypothetical protein